MGATILNHPVLAAPDEVTAKCSDHTTHVNFGWFKVMLNKYSKHL
jgi:hypothetical protein